MYDLLQLLLAERPLWITKEGYSQLMQFAFSMQGAGSSDMVENPVARAFLGFDIPTYKQECSTALSALKSMLAQNMSASSVNLTDDFSSPELPDGTIAYHRIFGAIFSDSKWWASSKQLEQDVLAAEQNSAITCHFFHINSPGGDAWYLDRLSETLSHCQKPKLVLCEGTCASAAYLIACHGNKVLATTAYDSIGSIGTMVSFYDYEDYYKQIGIKKVEAYATNSDLKNKLVRDLKDGKPKEFIERVINPMNEMFMSTVRSQRSLIANVEQDAPVLRGEIYYTQDAINVGLVDGMSTFVDAVVEAVQMGANYTESLKIRQQLYNI